LPTSPPPRAPRLSLEPITSEFLLKEADEPDDAPEDVDPRGAVPLPERFFVRTLTPNDVLKLQGERPGTFEPDLGEMARDRFPGFWGWQLEYEEVERRLIRLEWRPTGRLFSSVAPPDGIPIVLTLWFRESRPGHAAEHRLGIGPIGDVRQATPLDFDTTSLLVVERAPEEAEYAYVVRLITQREPAYEDYASYLIVARPRHRFGYGP
jgi:hypothetical protein